MEREPFNTELPGILFKLAVYLSSEVSISSPHFTQSDATLHRCRALLRVAGATRQLFRCKIVSRLRGTDNYVAKVRAAAPLTSS